MIRRTLMMTALAVLVVQGCDSPARPGSDSGELEPPALLARQGGRSIPDRYIVVFRDGVADPSSLARGLARAHGLQLRHTYTRALAGFAAVVPPGRAAVLRADPRIRYVVPDVLDHVHQQSELLPTGVDRIEAELNTSAPADPVDVDIAILDTGIDQDHPDLTVYRAVSFAGGNPEDGMGHGTHVAGTAAAKADGAGVVGVAPGARLWAVKVCNNGGNCARSDIIAGLDYVVSKADSIDVVNMSLGGPGSDDGNCGRDTGDAEHEAICAAVDRGVVVVVSAGNTGADAVWLAPASYDEVITVSALADFDGRPGGVGAATCRSDEDDSFASFSSYGPDVDLMAPGVCILSTWKQGGFNTLSGTSMAAPHVTGTAALYVAAHGRDANGDGGIDGADVDYVRSALVAGGIAQTDAACGLSVLDDPDTSPEPIVFGNALNVGGDGSCGGETRTDLAITNVAAPAGVVPGAVVDVTVTVVNVGGLDATDDIPVTLVSDNATADPGDDIAIGTRTVAGLPAGFSTDLTFSWNTAGASVGGHTLTAAQGFPDDNTSNDVATAAVALGATLHVGNLDRASGQGSQGGTWRAWVRITVHDAGDSPLADATVRGHWDSGFTEEPTCKTGSDGTCEVFLDGIPKKDGNVLFTVDVVSHDGSTYLADANHDVDGNSDGTSIRVFFVNSDDYKKSGG